MIFSYNWLKSFFRKNLPGPKKLADVLTMKAFEVKEVKKFGKDWILNIDVPTNRADCLSHLGIAKEISAILNLKLKTKESLLKEDKKLKTKDFVNVEVKNKNECRRYTAKVIFDVKVKSSPNWIQERLKACNLRPINNIVDAANYVMLETGQPLHAFDLEKLKEKKIIVRFAKKGEKILTLDGEKYSLDENILVIADKKDPVAIAGIKGGKIAEIDKKTKIVVLESANFERRTIRQAVKKLRLKTDASFRFEHGLDPSLTKIAIERAALLISKIANGKVAQGVIDVYEKKVLPKKIKLDLDYVEKLLGVKIAKKEIKNILKRFGFEVSEILAKKFSVKIPTLRQDIKIEEDLIEEIGRIYGLEKIPLALPKILLAPPERNLEIFWEEMAKNILKEVQFSEIYNYSFISQKDAKIFGFKNLIEVKNPTSLDFQYLRPSLIPNLLKNVQKNQKNFSEIKIFEIGKVFKIESSKPIEKKMLTGLITGDSFFKVKGILDSIFEKMGIAEKFYDQYKPTPEETKAFVWHPKKIAEIRINGEEIGFFGEISRRILKQYQILPKLTLFDIDFEKLQRHCSEEQEFQPISRYPAAIRDIAVLVPKYTRVEDVLNEIERISPLIKDIDLFDIYEGEEIPEGKKNLAFHIIFQAKDRALSSKEIEKIQAKIIAALEKNPDWEVRK